MTQPQHDPNQHGPSRREAEIIPFKLPRGAEELDPAELTLAECVSFYIHKWNHPAHTDRAIADAINNDTARKDYDDRWQARLEQAINSSPLFDHYDELLEADPITRLLDSVMRSTIPARGTMTDERKAMSALMYMRATEVLAEPEEEIHSQLQRIPLGDEALWQSVTRRLAGEQ